MNVIVSCPVCSGKGKVTRRRISREGLLIRRRRCQDCGHLWYTLQPSEVWCPPGAVRYGADADGLEEVYLANGPFKERWA